MNELCIYSKSPEETDAIAACIAPFFHQGDVLIFNGDLGTGKTHFVKALAAVLGSPDGVSSPTYTIANFYRLPEGNLLHIDAYRLSGTAEFRDLGLDDYFPEAISMVEWGAKYADEFEDYLWLSLEFDGADKSRRKMKIHFAGDRWASDFELIKEKLADFQK